MKLFFRSFLSLSLSLGLSLTPVLLFAAVTVKKTVLSADDISNQLYTNLIGPLFGISLTGVFVYFLFGVMRFFIDRDQNEDARTKLRKHLLWGMVGLFIVFSIGGIIKFFSSFGGGFS